MLHTRFCTIKTNEKILMVKQRGNGSYYTLPGGAVKLEKHWKKQ